MARRPVNWFEDVVTVDVPTDMLQQAAQGRFDLSEDRAAASRGATA